jgi:predicted lipoprotein with Yx(FWY)xxD motif
VQDNPGGQVLADAHGHTVYLYNCVDDAADQQSCDHPSLTQAYRLAVCGGFDAKKCLDQFPYVIADRNAKSDSHIWAVKDIDPMTGRYVSAGTPGSLHIWTYRDRPVYTFAYDTAPGDTRANSWGEGNGWRNGFHAFWTREEFRKQF